MYLVCFSNLDLFILGYVKAKLLDELRKPKVRWPIRVIPNKHFSNLQIHFKPKNVYFKSRSISRMSIYILESSKHYLKSITIIQIEKFIFEIKIYFSNLQNYNSNWL